MSSLKEHLLLWPSLAILGLAEIALIYSIHVTLPQQEVGYDCRLAEISPDIPIKVKEECRKLRSQLK